jgi:hypothetical protein
VVSLLGGSLALVALFLVQPPERRRVRIAALIVLADALAYGVASRRVDYRGLTWAAPALALVVATGADIVLRRVRHESG